MSRIKTAHQIADSEAKSFGYTGVMDAMVNGSDEHKKSIRDKHSAYLLKTKPTRMSEWNNLKRLSFKKRSATLH